MTRNIIENLSKILGKRSRPDDLTLDLDNMIKPQALEAPQPGWRARKHMEDLLDQGVIADRIKKTCIWYQLVTSNEPRTLQL